MILSNKAHDILKWFVLAILPAMAVFYSSLSGIWNLPYSEQVVGTIVAIETFLGVILGISTYKYNATGNKPFSLVPSGRVESWVLSDRAYKIMIWVAQVILPAATTFIFTIGQIWGLPGGAQIVQTLVVFDTFLGLVLGFSSQQYFKGMNSVPENSWGER
jgi:hypothetical protein